MTSGYVGNWYEVGASTKKYYYIAGRRVAMRDGGTQYFLLSDHLGSQAITADNNGSQVAELRYKAWGETRYTNGTTPTSYHFTGQREESTLGLYFYGARWYDAALGRFVQADTLVQSQECALSVSYAEPDVLQRCNGNTGAAGKQSDTQSLNRFSYTGNNPVRHVDSDGHLWFLAPLAAGAIMGAALSTGAYIATTWMTGGKITAAGVAGAAASGAVAGAVSVFATPLAGTALKAVGLPAGKTLLTVGSTLINGAGGVGAYLVGGATENIVNTSAGEEATFVPSAKAAIANSVVAGALGFAAGKIVSLKGNVMNTLAQAEYFMPGRSSCSILRSLVDWGDEALSNARRLYLGQSSIPTGLGAAAGVGINEILADSEE